MESKKRKTFLLTLLLMVCLVLHAQNLQVSGTIVSKSDGQPVIGATILEQGTTNGTITDFDGNFTVKASKGDILVISYVGYKTLELDLKNKTTLGVISLGEDTETLEEVVATWHNTNLRKILPTAYIGY